MFMFYLFHMMSVWAKLENVSQNKEKNKMRPECFIIILGATFIMNKLLMEGEEEGGLSVMFC